MTPTPPTHPSFSDSFRFRSRRQRNANPYDPSRDATPSQTHPQPRVTPLEDDGEGLGGELSDGDIEDEDEEDDVEEEIDDEVNEAEEEGGIEEGLFYTSFALSSQPVVLMRSGWPLFPAP
jgi:hypothetical protein